jgi:hypothetical protein
VSPLERTRPGFVSLSCSLGTQVDSPIWEGGLLILGHMPAEPNNGYGDTA